MTGRSVVLVPPGVVPGTMVVKPLGTTGEEVIGAERQFGGAKRREKFFSGGTKFSKVVPLLGGSRGMLPRKNFENGAVRLAKNAFASI